MAKRMMQTVTFAAGAAFIGAILYWQVDIIRRGGPIMILIIMCSVFSVAITFERLYYFFSLGADTGQFLAQLRGFVQGRRWDEAESLCKRTSGPIARVTRAGIRVREQPPQEIDSVMEEAAHEELPQVERHHQWLSTIAQISTLLGLLGTVIGMVVAFQIIQSKATSTNPVSPSDLAGGIWQALITTAAGLVVAIPTILAFNYLASRVAEVQFQMEKAASLVVNWRRTTANE